jgi:hypothetical protein
MNKLLYIPLLLLTSCILCPDCNDFATVEVRYPEMRSTARFLIRPGENRIVYAHCDSVPRAFDSLIVYDTINISNYADSVLDVVFERNIALNKKEAALKMYLDSCKAVDLAFWEYNEKKYQEQFARLKWRDSIFNDMFMRYPDFVDSLNGAYAYVNGYTIMQVDSGKYVVYGKNDEPMVLKTQEK